MILCNWVRMGQRSLKRATGKEEAVYDRSCGGPCQVEGG